MLKSNDHEDALITPKNESAWGGKVTATLPDRTLRIQLYRRDVKVYSTAGTPVSLAERFCHSVGG